MKIDMSYIFEDKTLQQYKRDKIEQLKNTLQYIKEKDYHILKEEYKSEEISISASKKSSFIYTLEEQERAIKELNKYIDIVKDLNINLGDDVWELGCKLYIFLGTQEKTSRCIKDLGYRFKFDRSIDEDSINKLIEDKEGFILNGADLFYLFLNEKEKESQLGDITYEIHMRNCYKRSHKGSWRSFKVIEYMVENWDYRL